MRLDKFLIDYFKKEDKVTVFAQELQDVVKENLNLKQRVKILEERIESLELILEVTKNSQEFPHVDLRG